MKKIIFIIAIISISSGVGFSQSLWNLNYDVSMPTGDLSNFVDEPGLRGMRVNGNWFINDNLSLGGTVQWTGFNKKYERNTYQLEDGAITSTNWNRVYSAPFLFNAYYHFMPDGTVSPYLGVGVGSYFIQQETQTGKYIVQDKNWKMGISPEAGAFIPFGRSGFGMNAKLAYNVVFYNMNNINMLSYVSLSVGFSFSSY